MSGKGTHPLNSKQVNVIVEPVDKEYGEYAIPSYSFLKSNSKRVTISLRNMSCQPVTLHKSMVVARLSPVNVIPEKLAPKLELIKLASCQLKLAKDQGLKINQLELESELIQISNMNQATRDRIDKRFTKLDLSGCSEWSKEQQKMVRELIIKHHNIFAVEDNELG